MSDAVTRTPIDMNEAFDTLKRLQSAAPSPTATRLGQIVELLQSLSEENTQLYTRLMAERPNSLQATIDNPLLPFSAAQLPEAAQQLYRGVNDALRPPLVAIRSRAELVQAGLLGQITKEQDEWLQAVQENTNRAFAVLDAVQEMIELQQGRLRITPVNFLSTDLLSEAWERQRDRAHEYEHEVSIQAPDIVPLARGDFYHSLIVLTDLLDNAIRYTPPRGNIRLSVDNMGTHVLFTVADSGIGLTEDDTQNVSRPFWRGVHHRLVRAHTGTGLRLFIDKQVLAQQNGQLFFYGEPGVGSTFSFTLPIPE